MVLYDVVASMNYQQNVKVVIHVDNFEIDNSSHDDLLVFRMYVTGMEHDQSLLFAIPNCFTCVSC